MRRANDVVEMQKSLFMLTVQSNEITQRCQINHNKLSCAMTCNSTQQHAVVTNINI